MDKCLLIRFSFLSINIIKVLQVEQGQFTKHTIPTATTNPSLIIAKERYWNVRCKGLLDLKAKTNSQHGDSFGCSSIIIFLLLSDSFTPNYNSFYATQLNWLRLPAMPVPLCVSKPKGLIYVVQPQQTSLRDQFMRFRLAEVLLVWVKKHCVS